MIFGREHAGDNSDAGAGGNKTTWVNGRAVAGARGSTNKLATLFHMGTLNANNTTTGQCNIDQVSISTLGRIGP